MNSNFIRTTWKSIAAEPLEWLHWAMFHQVGLRTFYVFGKHSKISKKEIRFVCFYQLDIITEFINIEERSFSGADFSRRWEVRMLKNANSVPDVPRILIIRLKRRYICTYQCVLLLRLMFLLLSARFFCNLPALSVPFNFGTLFITLLCFWAETLFAGNGDPLKVENWGIIERLWLHEYQLWGRAGGTWCCRVKKVEILREIALKLLSGHAREAVLKVSQTSSGSIQDHMKWTASMFLIQWQQTL